MGNLIVLAGLLSPLFGFGAAVHYYLKYRSAPDPKHHPSIPLYVLGLVGAAILAFVVGTFAGVQVACRSPEAGNLCGLWGFFISGPLLATATMIMFARNWLKRVLKAPPTAK